MIESRAGRRRRRRRGGAAGRPCVAIIPVPVWPSQSQASKASPAAAALAEPPAAEPSSGPRAPSRRGGPQGGRGFCLDASRPAARGSPRMCCCACVARRGRRAAVRAAGAFSKISFAVAATAAAALVAAPLGVGAAHFWGVGEGGESQPPWLLLPLLFGSLPLVGSSDHQRQRQQKSDCKRWSGDRHSQRASLVSGVILF